MAEITLYSPWTMKLAFPYDFEKVMEMANVKRISYKTEDCSRYNKRTQGKSAKLHPPTISALLKLILMKNGKTEGACGIQKQENVNYFLMEYEKPKERCILVYNRKNGRFIGQRITENGEERLVPVENGISNGEEYLAVLAYASTLPVSPLYDEEFAYHFLVLEKQYLNHWDVPKEAINAAYICCDNLYRRITAPPEEAIPLEQVQFQVNGKMDFLVGYKVKLGVYEPNDQIWGTFRYLKAHPNSRARQCTIADMKKIYSCGWEITSGSKDKIPTLPETYRVSEDAEEILQRIIDTPARMFMITGGAGGGKTTDAKIIAQVLGLPYYVFTCGPDTDELSLLASTVPNVGKEEVNPPEYPLLEDMMMDPATALSMVSGTYQEGISQETAFRELLKAVYQQGYEQAKKEKDFLIKESEIVKACREACVLEIQEPATIEKPGTLVRLNSLFDDGACTDLLDGRKIIRNPNTVVIMTTNLNYAGCQAFNASVVSRMSLVQHREELSVEAMMQRVIDRTGFDEEEVLLFMASTIQKIREHLEREDLQGGICGYRELENWVWSYKTTGNLLKSVKNTVISKAALLPEDRKVLMDTYIVPYLSA